MAEPVISTAAAKAAAGIGGLFGGLAILTFLKPHNLRDAAIRGGVSTGSAIIGSAPLTRYLGMDSSQSLVEKQLKFSTLMLKVD